MYSELDQRRSVLETAILSYYEEYTRRMQACRKDYVRVMKEQNLVPLSEHDQRRSMVNEINETLDYRSLVCFGSTHLGMLKLLVSCWRDCEPDKIGDETNCPTPQPEPHDGLTALREAARQRRSRLMRLWREM